MLQIEDKILSFDIVDRHFCCDVEKCKGACCIRGDSGAPLEKEEMKILEQIYPKLQKYLQPEGIRAIEEQGIHVVDSDGDNVTPLVNNKECAYVVFFKGIAKCGIELAYLNKKISFRKPVSCHLYPVRIKKYKDFEAVNYDKWEICKPARILGKQLDIPVYRFVKEALIRKYSKDWYKKLEKAAKELHQTK